MSLLRLRPRGAALWIGAVVLLVSTIAFAQAPRVDRSFDPSLFHPAPGPDEFITVESAVPLRHKSYGLGLFFNYARDEFSIFNYDQSKSSTTTVRSNLLQNALGGEIWAAYGLFNRFQIALSLPMTIYQNGQSFTDVNPPPGGTTVKAPNGFALGDPRLYLKGRVYGKDQGLQLAISKWVGISARQRRAVRRREALQRLLRRAARAGRLGGGALALGRVRRLQLARAHVAASSRPSSATSSPTAVHLRMTLLYIV